MKKNFLMFCGVTALMVLLASCTKQPTASFKLSKTTAAVGESITATFDGEDANTFSWTAYDGAVGDTPTGASSSNFITVSGGDRCENNWTVSFTTAGTYTIILTARNYKDGCECSDCSGKRDEVSQTVTIQ